MLANIDLIFGMEVSQHVLQIKFEFQYTPLIFGEISGWLVVLGFNATLKARVISWRSVMHVFPGFLTPVLTQLFFPKPSTTSLTCFCRGERRKYAGKKSRLNRGSNSQPPGHESDTLTTEPPGRAAKFLVLDLINFSLQTVFRTFFLSASRY